MLGTPYDIQEIAQLALAKDLFQGFYPSPKIKYVTFDSRTISHGSQTIFVALSTDNRDGHAFIRQAWEKGVRNFIVEKDPGIKDINYVLCENSLEGLQSWAMFHRQKFNYPVIAITGSNGKTTIKEWLATLLEAEYQIVKSPMSYNSQLGVPVSLLQMYPQADLAIIEAGISLPGEMAVLEQMIQPTLGILTHMGAAHADGFSSFDEKLSEKLELFTGVENVLTGNQPEVIHALQAREIKFSQVGEKEQAILTQYGPPDWAGDAEKENLLLTILAARYCRLTEEEIPARMSLLYPVSMRMEMITDNPEITIINDSYNSDPDSVRSAFQRLMNLSIQPNSHIIISDIPHQGEFQQELQADILREAVHLVGEKNVRTVGPGFASLGHPLSYLTTEELIQNMDYETFRDSTVLLKGARSFALEKIIPYLNRKLNATYFKVNLSALSHNFRTLKARIPEGTKTMCMVKAASYGSGTWEIAQALVAEGADYLTVAYASEGIELRNAGIDIPIMVMNPDLSSVDALLAMDIEPEVSNLQFLQAYIRAARLNGNSQAKIHLKLETGMGRLGFHQEDLPQLADLLLQYPDIQVVSVMSHLAAADMPGEDEFSHHQVEAFVGMDHQLQQLTGIHPLRHILNTAGILRFPQYAMDMVRLGIGLYGISPVSEATDLAEIGSLHSTISQIHTYPPGTSIGYGRSQITERETRIATIPVGYADGIPRSLGNGKFAFLVRGKPAPVFGRVCMDMLMLDITDIRNPEVGDEVILFGHSPDQTPSITDLAEAADTIPYEILVRISPRVRRVYVRE